MDWFTGIIVYLLIWWVVLFAVLPWWIRGTVQRDEPHLAHGAPVEPRIGRKFLVTTAIAAGLWLVIFMLIQIEIINFRELAGQMAR